VKHIPKASSARLVYGCQLRSATRAVTDILNEFETLDQVQFDPFKPKAHTKARENLSQSFLSLSQPQPFDYFNLFLTGDLWKTITTNSNRYAAFQHRTNLKSVAGHGKTFY
jgi:hypothetical protein